MKNVKIFSFFSGVGFLDLGFENAGFSIDFVNEVNKTFLYSYKYARGDCSHKPLYGYSDKDIREYLKDEVWDNQFSNYEKDKELIGFIGGPPCPDFSTAGKNRGEKGLNGQLTYTYVSLICKRLPDFFVLENVAGLYRTQKHRIFYERMKRKLYSAGYSLFDSIENALEYGVPQNRERLILVGFRRARFGRNIKFQLGNNKKYKLSDINNIEWPGVTMFKEGSELLPYDNRFIDLTVEYWFRVNNVQNHINGNDVFKVKNLIRFLEIQEGDVTRKSFKRLHRWRYAPTAAFGNNEVHLHPYYARRISVAEALAIQSLPIGFKVPIDISLSSKFKMVGNGVPYLLSLGVARDISEFIKYFLQE